MVKFSAPILALALLGLSLPAVPARAQSAQLIGTYGDWSAFVMEEGGQKVCYAFSRPKKQEGKYRTRGDSYIQITHRPAENSYDVVSVIAGYTYKPKSSVKVQVDGRTYTLFTDNDSAWASSAKEDAALARAIRQGSRMIVRGTSSRGTLTADTYSLKGSGAAHKAMNDACGVRGRD